MSEHDQTESRQSEQNSPKETESQKSQSQADKPSENDDSAEPQVIHTDKAKQQERSVLKEQEMSNAHMPRAEQQAMPNKNQDHSQEPIEATETVKEQSKDPQQIVLNTQLPSKQEDSLAETKIQKVQQQEPGKLLTEEQRETNTQGRQNKQEESKEPSQRHEKVNQQQPEAHEQSKIEKQPSQKSQGRKSNKFMSKQGQFDRKDVALMIDQPGEPILSAEQPPKEIEKPKEEVNARQQVSSNEKVNLNKDEEGAQGKAEIQVSEPAIDQGKVEEVRSNNEVQNKEENKSQQHQAEKLSAQQAIEPKTSEIESNRGQEQQDQETPSQKSKEIEDISEKQSVKSHHIAQLQAHNHKANLITPKALQQQEFKEHKVSPQKPKPHQAVKQSPQTLQPSPISQKKKVGKISRTMVRNEKVLDAVVELRKSDEKKTLVPGLSPPAPAKKKAPSEMLDKITKPLVVDNSVFSLKLGDHMEKRADQEMDSMLSEIAYLKHKLAELEKRKQLEEELLEKEKKEEAQRLQMQKRRKELQEEEQRRERQLRDIEPAHYSGKIYRKVEQERSQVSQPMRTIGYSTLQPQSKTVKVVSGSSSNRKYSSTQKPQYTASEVNEFPNMQTTPVNFRVKRNNRSQHGQEQYANQPSFNKTPQSSSKYIQAKRQEVYGKLQFSNEEKLDLVERAAPRQLAIDPNFRAEAEKFFLDIGTACPSRNSTQTQLIELAKDAYRKWGVSLEDERGTLGMKKYKNCVAFTLDEQRSILWYYDGRFYYGGWVVGESGDGEKSGWGYDFCPTKYVYNGQFIANKRNGYGIIKFLTKERDTLYEGQWNNGLREGKGRQDEADGSQFMGNWHMGKRHGMGVVRGCQEESFSGHFVNGFKNGRGKQTFKNGDQYQGNYFNGKFEGKGQYTWANLTRYEGEFKNGCRNGFGKWISNHLDPDSDNYQGQYIDDKKNGYGIYRWRDGTRYEGQFINDLKHGQGVIIYGDGRSAALQWSQGNVVKQDSRRRKSSTGSTPQPSQRGGNSSQKRRVRI